MESEKLSRLHFVKSLLPKSAGDIHLGKEEEEVDFTGGLYFMGVERGEKGCQGGNTVYPGLDSRGERDII